MMKIAVIGADTHLGNKVASEAYHRRNRVTAIVRDPALLLSAKYEVVRSDDYACEKDAYDAVFDVTGDEIRIEAGGKKTILKPAAEADPESHRTGYYRVAESPAAYLGEEDFALAALDFLEKGEEGTYYIESDPPKAPVQDTDGKRRYLAFPDKGIKGKKYHLLMDSNEEYLLDFLTDDTALIGAAGEPMERYSICPMHCDEDVWFVSFMKGETCVSLVLDEGQSLVTAIYAEVYLKKMQLVHYRYLFGAIKKPGEAVPFKRHYFTDELAGQKVTWHYSPYVNITHCYVTENYMRNSLRNMKPLPEDAPPEAVFDAVDRVRRWGDIFFEEPCEYIHINPHLFIFSMREANRNRTDPLQGGGGMVIAFNTRRMHDYGRGFPSGQADHYYNLFSVDGDWDDMPDPMDTAESPYLA